MDSTEIPVYGQQEQSAYNGHFESTCYRPLLLFNREGDCLAAKLRPGNVHSAEDWEDVLLPEIERQQKLGEEVLCRAVAAFAKPTIVEARGARGGVAGEVLHVFERHALFEQVGDDGDAEQVRRETRGQGSVRQAALHHAADVVHVDGRGRELAGLADRGACAGACCRPATSM